MNPERAAALLAVAGVALIGVVAVQFAVIACRISAECDDLARDNEALRAAVLYLNEKTPAPE